ncbi:MAG TPA: radical SAM protein, partial [Tepidisphaeraceae bacterium]
MKTLAVCSFLHESAAPNSATRRFRDRSVFWWTQQRIAQAVGVGETVAIAWEDQAAAVRACGDFTVHTIGRRCSLAEMESVTVAQKWADGWRGGLLDTSAFDKGFDASIIRDLVAGRCDAVLLVDPAAGLVDPTLLDALINKAAAGTRDCYFAPAASGLGAMLLKTSMLDRLVSARTHPGRVLHYIPDAPMLDPITSEACLEVPLAVSRAVGRYTLDSDRQINMLSTATMPLNGSLLSSNAESIVQHVAAAKVPQRFPREVTVEVTSRRASRPFFAPGTHRTITRADMPLELFQSICSEISSVDDARLCIGGHGDPLLHPDFACLLECCEGLHAVAIETDLIELSEESLHAILRTDIDVVSINLPATAPTTYERVMGVDAMARVVENIKRLLTARQALGRRVPLIVPRFTKLEMNFEEMELWHDTWLRALHAATILGPSDFAAQIPDFAVADMSPPKRGPCRRIDN